MKTKHILLNGLVMLVISVGTLLTYKWQLEPKTAYIDIKKVFNNFQMKKELESKYKTIEKERTRILDSLMTDVNILARYLNEEKRNKREVDQLMVEKFELKREKFLKTKEKFTEDNTALSARYDNDILERLNQYIAEYGKDMDFDFIYGADGNGSLMYSNNRFDLSDQVTVFINNKYNGLE